MIFPLFKSAVYALVICLLPWSVGALLLLRPTSVAALGSLVGEPAFVVFPVVATCAVLTGRLLWPMATRLRTASVDTVTYTVTLLFVTIIGSAAGDAGGLAVDAGFVALILAGFTLQYPLCFALSLALSRRLLGQDRPILN